MLQYIGHETIKALIGSDIRLVKNWVKDALRLHFLRQCHQPLKTYLQITDNPYDRAIALPAFIQGEDPIVGIKWIGSHSGNTFRGIQRAHALIILNKPETMQPYAVIEGSLISTMRTFSVSLLAIEKFFKKGASVGLIGMGKLGLMHATQLGVLHPQISEIHCFSKSVNISSLDVPKKVKVASSLTEVLDSSDILISASKATEPYITPADLKNRTTLIINQSLMDFSVDVIAESDYVIVDDWEQNSRANKVFKQGVDQGVILKNDVEELGAVIHGPEMHRPGRVFINTLGMGLEDLYVARQVYKQAEALDMLQQLEQ